MNKDVRSSFYIDKRSASLSENNSINLEVSIRDLRSFHFSSVSMCACSAILVCVCMHVIHDGIDEEKRAKIAGRVKEALTLQASHVLNASWGYGVQYPATDGGVQHAGAISS